MVPTKQPNTDESIDKFSSFLTHHIFQHVVVKNDYYGIFDIFTITITNTTTATSSLSSFIILVLNSSVNKKNQNRIKTDVIHNNDLLFLEEK